MTQPKQPIPISHLSSRRNQKLGGVLLKSLEEPDLDMLDAYQRDFMQLQQLYF